MIEISDSNPWAEHLDGLSEERDHHQRAADQLLSEYNKARAQAEVWEMRAADRLDELEDRAGAGGW